MLLFLLLHTIKLLRRFFVQIHPRKSNVQFSQFLTVQVPSFGAPEPERQLHKLCQAAVVAAPHDLPMLASEALAAFQQCAANGFVPGHAFANLLCVLGCGNLWETAFDVYRTVTVKVSNIPVQLRQTTVSALLIHFTCST